MNTPFASPATYLTWSRGDGDDLDIAFVPISAGATPDDCVAYLKEKHCCLVWGSAGAMNALNMLMSHLPETGRVVVATERDGVQIFDVRNGQQGPLHEGDFLLCYRLTVYGMSDAFPKEPFNGKRHMMREADY